MTATPKLPTGMAGKLARAVFLGRTYRQRSLVNVGTGVTQLLKNNPDRVGWLAVNRGTSDGAFDFINGVTFAAGYPLAAQSGVARMVFNEDGEACGDEVWAINATAAGNWAVTEIIAIPVEED